MSERFRAQVADLRIEAAVAPEPPHRLIGFRLYPTGIRVTDPRTSNPPAERSGEVPEPAIRVADESSAGTGLVGLVLAGASIADGPVRPWALARGWADLDRPEPLRVDHRFPAYGTTKPITATAVLDLDGPVNRQLRSLRLADDEVTVRDLLTHTGGVGNPATPFADRVTGGLAALVGSPVPCDSERGTFAASNGGYAVLGHLIADVTGTG